jgi:hypothetical protein
MFHYTWWILIWQISPADVLQLNTIPGESCSDKYPEQMFQGWTLFLVDPADVRYSRVGQILIWQVSSADVPELDTIPGRSCSDKCPLQVFQS